MIHLLNYFAETGDTALSIIWKACNPLLVSIVVLLIYQSTTRIKIPWWVYLIGMLALVPWSISLPFAYLGLVIVPLIIYLFVVHRTHSFTAIISPYVYVIFTYSVITAIMGPLVMEIYGYFSPQTLLTFSNIGANFMVLLEGYLTHLILKSFQNTYRKYTQVIIRQRPLIAWLTNIFYASFLLVRFGYHYQIIKVSMPLYFLIVLAYLVVTLCAIKISSNYYGYRDLSISQGIELENLQKYTSHIEAMYDDLRRFRHDYKNILLSLRDAIQSGTIEEVRQLFNQIVLPTNNDVEIQTAVLGHLQNIENLELKSLVYSKVMTAIDKGIDVTVEVADPINVSQRLTLVDALRMIAILFDNAINAAAESKDKKMSFSFFDKADAQYIIVGNSTKEEIVDLQKLTGTFKGLSNGHHSLGLRNLRILLAKYAFIQHNVSASHHWVEQVIIIHGIDKK